MNSVVPTYCDIITSNMTSTLYVVTNCQKRMKVQRNLTSQIFNNLNGKLSQKLQTKHIGLQSKGNNSVVNSEYTSHDLMFGIIKSKHL